MPMKVLIDRHNRLFQCFFSTKVECPTLTSALTCIAMYQGFFLSFLPGMRDRGVKTDFTPTGGK
jgi:hypothetical protein